MSLTKELSFGGLKGSHIRSAISIEQVLFTRN